jgi:hypothetical protein
LGAHFYEGSAAGNDLTVCAPNTYPQSQVFNLPFSPYYGTPAIVNIAAYGPPPLNVNYLRCNATNGNVTITLPPLVGGWRYITVKRIDNTFATAGFTCSVVPSAGDTISDGASSLILTQSNSTVTLADVPTSATAAAWHKQNVGGNASQLVSFCTGAGYTTNGVYFLAPAANGGTLCNAVGTNGQGIPMPYACTARSFQAVAGSHTGGVAITFVVNKNGTATALGCIMAANATNCPIDNTDLVGFGVGDMWSVTYSPAAGTDTSANLRATFQCTQQ